SARERSAEDQKRERDQRGAREHPQRRGGAPSRPVRGRDGQSRANQTGSEEPRSGSCRQESRKQHTESSGEGASEGRGSGCCRTDTVEYRTRRRRCRSGRHDLGGGQQRRSGSYGQEYSPDLGEAWSTVELVGGSPCDGAPRRLVEAGWVERTTRSGRARSVVQRCEEPGTLTGIGLLATPNPSDAGQDL